MANSRKKKLEELVNARNQDANSFFTEKKPTRSDVGKKQKEDSNKFKKEATTRATEGRTSRSYTNNTSNNEYMLPTRGRLGNRNNESSAIDRIQPAQRAERIDYFKGMNLNSSNIGNSQQDVSRKVFETLNPGQKLNYTKSNSNVFNYGISDFARETLLPRISFVGKSTGAGVASGTAGIGQAYLTHSANQAQKGSQADTKQTLKNVVQFFNPMLGFSGSVGDIGNSIANTIRDKDKSTSEKVGEILTNVASGAMNLTPHRQVLNSGMQVGGKLFGQDMSNNLMTANEKISKPIREMNQKLAEEGEQYDSTTRMLAQTGQVVGNMAPSIAVTALTKNPNAGLTVMGLSAKGQATEEALQRGADLDKAVKIGDAKEMVEVGTEMLTGGLNIFGKGALDKIVERGIDKKVKSKVMNYLTKQGMGIAGEVGEETISDILNTVIDKGTVDKNATYSIDDWKDTTLTTMLSTVVLNALGGGYTPRAYNQNVQDMQQFEVKENLRQNINENNTLTKQDKEQMLDYLDNNYITEADDLAMKQKLGIAVQDNSISNDSQEQSNAKETMLERIDKSTLSSEDKAQMRNYIANNEVSNADIMAMNQVIDNAITAPANNELVTNQNYKDNVEARRKYTKYKNDTNDYNAQVVDEVLDTVPVNRNGRRTVKQWLGAAQEIGTRIADLSNEEIERIAYKSWFDNEPSKNITKYDNQTKSNVGFQKLTSDEWINSINKGVNEARTNNQVQEDQNNSVAIEEEKQKRLEHLKNIDTSEMGLIERGKIKTEIRALEQGYNSIEEYQEAERLKREQAKKEYEQRQKEKENIESQKKLQLEKDIKESTPMKNAQFEIIQKTNPMLDDYHTGIRTPKDIKTFDEVIKDEESFVWGDFSREDAQKALQEGKITIYSSYPIENGTFVSTSKKQAEDYAGGRGNKVYSQEVPLNEVAWISGDEGQYAKVIEGNQNILPTNLQNKIDVDQDTEQNKPNIINEKVNNYISEVKDNFNTDINIETKSLNDGNISFIDYSKVNQSGLAKKAQSLVDKFKTRVFKNNNEDIYVSNRDIGKSISETLRNNEQRPYKLENLAVFSQLDKIIKNGKEISYQPIDSKGRKYYSDYKYYVSNAYIDEKPYVVEFDTRLQKGTKGNLERHFRLERVYPINRNEVVSNAVPKNDNMLSNETTSNNSIPFLKENVNTTNKSMQNTENNTPNKTVLEKTDESNRIMNPTEISNLKPEDMNTTPKIPTRSYKKGNKQSSFLSNVVTDSQFLNEDLRQELAKEENIRYYKGVTNQETLEKAYKSLSENGETETVNWFNKDGKNATAEDVAKGWILLKQYQDAGDYQGAVEVAKKMRDMGTKAGQTVQAYNMMSRLTPEGMFYYAQSELNEAYNKAVEGKSKKWIDANKDKFDLTPEETNFIKENMKEVAGMEDGYDKKVKLAEIQKVISDKIPPTVGQSVKAWMRISMLFNPKTQIRNVLGNAVIAPVNVASDSISSVIDRAIAKKTGVRTTGNMNLKSYGKGFGKGLYESYNDFRKGINTRNIEGNRFEVSEGKSFNDKGLGKALNRVDNLLSFMLDAGDRGFYEATFTNSINNQMVLNGTNEVTQDMIDIATNEALQRTWQDNNKYTEAVLRIRGILNNVNVKGYGLGDVIIPFAKTPANLTKAIVDYSPIGLTKAITMDAKKFSNSLQNGQYSPQLQHKFVQSLGKGMAGSFLYVLGYALAKAGIASGDADDDKDVKNFMKNSLGISSYSLKFGDKTFTYDWAQPVAVPLAIATNYVKYGKDNPNANAIEKASKALDIGTEQLLEQSFMESLNTVLNGNGTTLENLSKTVLDLPARAIPTFSKQIADMVDGTQRTTFEYDKPVKSAVNSVIAKLPIASKSLPVARDTLGNDVEKYGGDNNLFNVMLNPANVNKGKLSKAGEEIYRLYQETGETNIFPITAPYYINSKGERVNMTAEQRSEYQKVSGQYSEKVIDELLDNKDYRNLKEEDKASLLADIVSDSNAKAKHDVLDIETDDAKKKREFIERVSTKTYYDYTFKTKGMKKERDKKSVIANGDYSSKAKRILYENTTGSDDEFYNKVGKYVDITEYLKYQIQYSNKAFNTDRDKNGKTITSSKEKVYKYVNNNISSYGDRLIMIGRVYKLQDNERRDLANYLMKKTSGQDTLDAFGKLYKNFAVKNGKIYYK